MSAIGEIESDPGRRPPDAFARRAGAGETEKTEKRTPDRVTAARDGEMPAAGKKPKSRGYKVDIVPGTVRIVTSVLDYERGAVLFRIPTYWDYIKEGVAPREEKGRYL